MFNRRKFVTGLLALPGLAFAKFAPKLPTPQKTVSGIPGLGYWNGLVDRIMAKTKAHFGFSNKIQFGPWVVLWTGWKDSACNIDLRGQWVAFPVDQNGEADKTRLAVFVATPGGYGAFSRGDEFSTSYRWPQDLASRHMEIATSFESISETMEPERRIALECLLQLVQQGNWTTSESNDWKHLVSGEVNRNAWKGLSKRCRFYLDARAFIDDEFGHGAWDKDVNGELALSVKAKLFSEEITDWASDYYTTKKGRVKRLPWARDTQPTS